MQGGILFCRQETTRTAFNLVNIVQPATSSLLLVLISATVVALVMTDAVRRLALRLRWLDEPGIGRVHARAVPRIGGLAMFAAFTGTLLVAIWLREDLTFNLKFVGLLVAPRSSHL